MTVPLWRTWCPLCSSELSSPEPWGILPCCRRSIFPTAAADPIVNFLVMSLLGDVPSSVQIPAAIALEEDLITEVENELFSFGHKCHLKEMPLGPGSVPLKDANALVILALCHQEQSRSMRSYTFGLFIRICTTEIRVIFLSFSIMDSK